jgi:5-methylcytosine-specific restriction enzyme A
MRIMTALTQLKPTQKHLVMDLVEEAGVDVSDWKNYDGDVPSSNPKYCYNWSFLTPGEFIVVCLWFVDFEIDGDAIIHSHNIRLRDGRMGGKGAANWKRRAEEFDENIQTAYRAGLPVRVIICDGKRRDHLDLSPESSQVSGRMLDPIPWAISKYDFDTGDLLLIRGGLPREAAEQDAAEFVGFEGEQRQRYVLHRRREASVRKKKLQAAMYENDGVLKCEVPKCGFDFKARYGKLGEGFAHVHHLTPLADAPADGRKVALKELAVVCANCHAMIHVGGECRPIAGLIP